VRIRSVFTHSAQVIAEGALLSLLVVGLMAGTTFAAKGGGHAGTTTGGGTITLAPLVKDLNANGVANRGDTVTFNVSTTATDEPFVNLQCFQNGVRVLNGTAGFFAWAMNAPYYDFDLNTGTWPSGTAADCTAYLEKSTTKGWSRLASTSFHVDP